MLALKEVVSVFKGSLISGSILLCENNEGKILTFLPSFNNESLFGNDFFDSNLVKISTQHYFKFGFSAVESGLFNQIPPIRFWAFLSKVSRTYQIINISKKAGAKNNPSLS